MKADLITFLKSLNINPNDPSLYEEALTHSSYNAIAGTKHHDYERLEFLGDSLIGFVVAELCFRYHPEMQQGDLSMLKSQFIRTESEASMALSLNLGPYIRVGASFDHDVKASNRILEDIFESFIGALIIDQGNPFAYQFVRSLFEEEIARASLKENINPKSELQEAIQAEFKEAVEYKTISEFGPPNDKHYVVAVYFEKLELGRGEGRSKKEAETEAARDALSKNAANKLLALKDKNGD